MRYLKIVLFLGLVGAAGWGLYSAGEKNLLAFGDEDSDEVVQVVKKNRAVKPKSFFQKVRDVVPAQVKEYDYTFFETLQDVDLDRYVDLDGNVKVMKKTVHSWVDEVGKVIDEPRIILASYKEPEAGGETSSSSYQDIIDKLDDLMKKKPKKATPPSVSTRPAKRVAPPVRPGSSAKREVPAVQHVTPYMVQVSSFKKLSHARSLESRLKKKGYPAFVMSVKISEDKGRWYRVFLGKYPTEANARQAAKKAKRLHKLKTIIKKASR